MASGSSQRGWYRNVLPRVALRGHSANPLGTALTYLAGLILAWIAISTTVSVVSRALGGNPYSWTLELSEYGLLFVTLLPLATVTSRGEQIQVTIVNVDNAPHLTRVLDLFGEVLGAMLALVFTIATGYLAYTSFISGVYLTGVLRIPRWIILVGMAFATAMWTLAHVRRLISWRTAGPAT